MGKPCVGGSGKKPIPPSSTPWLSKSPSSFDFLEDGVVSGVEREIYVYL